MTRLIPLSSRKKNECRCALQSNNMDLLLTRLRSDLNRLPDETGGVKGRRATGAYFRKSYVPSEIFDTIKTLKTDTEGFSKDCGFDSSPILKEVGVIESYVKDGRNKYASNRVHNLKESLYQGLDNCAVG